MKPKIVIVREFRLADFQHEINRLLSLGWRLHGGMVVALDGSMLQMMELVVAYTDGD